MSRQTHSAIRKILTVLCLAASPGIVFGDEPLSVVRQSGSSENAGFHPTQHDVTEPAFAADESARPAADGTWLPTILPHNDLTDPPVNYPRCEGGACFGMATVVFGLWCSETEDDAMTLEEAAARFIHNFVPDRGGKLLNHSLPSHVYLDGVRTPLTERAAMVRIAETVQNKIQPGGGKHKTPEQIRAIHQEVSKIRSLDTVERLRHAVKRSGGRQVLGLLFFNRELTHSEGHAVILTLGKDNQFYVWDPNAKMEKDATGSGALSPLEIHADAAGNLQHVSYSITLPDGATQTRNFQYIFPATTFLTPQKMPKFPIMRHDDMETLLLLR